MFQYKSNIFFKTYVSQDLPHITHDLFHGQSVTTLIFALVCVHSWTSTKVE